MTYNNQNHTDRQKYPRPKYLWFRVYRRACLLTLQERGEVEDRKVREKREEVSKVSKVC